MIEFKRRVAEMMDSRDSRSPVWAEDMFRGNDKKVEIFHLSFPGLTGESTFFGLGDRPQRRNR